MNVIFFLSGLDSGGLENYLLRFLESYHHKFNKIYIWCKGGKGGFLEERYLSIPNVEIIKFSFGNFGFRRYKKLIYFIKLNNITTTCDFSGSFAGLTTMTSKMAGVQNRVVFYRNSRDKFKRTFLKVRYRKAIQYLTKKYATKILSNSYAALDYFYPHQYENDPKFKVIYNGIDAEKFKVKVDTKAILKDLNIPEGAFVIGHVGRFDSQKNHITILQVMNNLCAKYEDIYCILCGKDTVENLPSMIQKINPRLEEKVKVIGNRSDVNQLLQVMDVFYFPSTIEGQPNALIEAMISGVPFVASNIGPIKETIPKSLHKYLKNPKDVEGFTEWIERLYKSDKTRRELLCVDWATSRFDHTIQFDKFLNELKNGNGKTTI